ncbi:MAG: hypothetical protein ACLQSR_11845 [Limisphaerales bacterium]
MPIGPVSDSHRQIGVVEPVSPALERVKKMLFQPFDLGKWFVIGFCAWLAQLGESGGTGGNFGGNNFNHTNTVSGQNGMDQLRQGIQRAHEFALLNLAWIIPLAAFLILFVLALWILFLWLNSRGKFMFLHCVALDKAEVVEPWNRYSAPANSLFWFRLVLGLIGMVLMLPVIGFTVLLFVRMILSGGPTQIFAFIMLAAGLVMVILFFAIVFGLIHKFTVDFVVPIMYLRGGRCLAAWGEFWRMLCAYPGTFVLYILFQIAMALAIGVMVLIAIICTCCIAACFMIIPYIGTVLLLPIFIFRRSYSLYFLQQFGSDYDVFPPPISSPPPPPPPPPAAAGLNPLP